MLQNERPESLNFSQFVGGQSGQNTSLNLSEFVESGSQSMLKGVCVQNTPPLFSRDWCGTTDEETHLVSASVYALQIAIN